MFVEKDPHFRILKEHITVANKLSFYNKNRGWKYLPALDRTFCVDFNRNTFTYFTLPPTSMEILKPRAVTERTNLMMKEMI